MTFKLGHTTRRGQGFGIKWMREHVTYAGDDCLFWPLSHGDGYGSVSYQGKIYRAPRFMCELAHGEPPTPKHQAAHSCGNGHKACLNPNHLSWKTNGENQLDRRKHGTDNAWAVRGKFTPEQDAELRALAGTKTQIELAKMFGVSRSTIQYRLYGGSYKPRRQRIVFA